MLNVEGKHVQLAWEICQADLEMISPLQLPSFGGVEVGPEHRFQPGGGTLWGLPKVVWVGETGQGPPEGMHVLPGILRLPQFSLGWCSSKDTESSLLAAFWQEAPYYIILTAAISSLLLSKLLINWM